MSQILMGVDRPKADILRDRKYSMLVYKFSQVRKSNKYTVLRVRGISYAFLMLMVFSIAIPIAADEGVNTIIGKWKDKNDNTIRLEFKSGNNFKYNLGGKPKTIWQETMEEGLRNYGPPTNKYDNYSGSGAWEIGGWNVGSNRCNLMIHFGETNCCFEFKFLGDNLILHKIYSSNINSGFCSSRVLIREK